MRIILCCLFAAWVSGCGSRSEIVLVLSTTTLRVPEDFGRITVRSFGPSETVPRLDVALDVSGTRLPIDVLLEPSDDTPSPLRHEVDCYQGDAHVCALVATHPWQKDATTRVEIVLDGQ